MRLRTTAPPAGRPIANATRGGAGRSDAEGGSHVTVNGPRPARRPSWRKARKVRRSVTRQSCGLAQVLGGSTMAVVILDRPPLGRKTLAALEAACLDHRPSGAIGHPMTEAVTLGAAALVGLEGALHCLPPRLSVRGPAAMNLSTCAGCRSGGNPAGDPVGTPRRAGAPALVGAEATLEVRPRYRQPGDTATAR